MSTAPEIAITSDEGGAVADSGTDTFASSKTAGVATNVTYTITNSGTDTLTITTPTVVANISGETNVTVNSLVLGSTTVAPGGGTTTLVVNYTPTVAGSFDFDLSLANDDGDENPYNIAASGTATGTPDIAVSSSQGGALTDGNPNALGNKAVATQDTLTYTITNPGLANLTGLALTVNNASNVSIDNTPALSGTSITPSGTAVTFQVQYTPTNNGAFSFDVSIASNDPDENPFNFAVSGTGTGGAPDIAVSSSQGGALTDGVANTLGNKTVATQDTLTYTITNPGLANLTGLALTVNNASNVSIDNVPALSGGTSITPGGTAVTFDVQYTPTNNGAFSFDVSIASDDPDENPFNFVVSGTGTGGAPDIAVSSSQGGALTDGVANTLGNKAVTTQDTLTYTITNVGTADLTGLALTVDNEVNVALGTVTLLTGTSITPGGTAVTFQVPYTPTHNGAFSFDVSIASNDGDENPFNFAVSGTGTGGAPEIAISSSESGAVNDGATDTFVSTPAAGSASTVTYTITNSGTDTLTLTTPTVGTNISGASNITVNSLVLGSTSVAPGGETTTLVVNYTPTLGGSFGFALSLANDDGNENPYDITASGTASASPDIAVSSSQGGALTDGVANTLGNKTVATQDALTYTITNPGLANLTGLALTVNNASNVSIDNTPALSGTSIAPSGTAVTFQVQYTPTNNGAFSFDVSIASDDPDENPFNFAVSGTGTGGAPDIAVSSSQGGALTDGVANALGNKAVTTQDTLTYTITNVGTADLTGLALTVDNASNVTLGTVTALTGTSITPGGTAVTFQVPYTPTHNGAFSFDVSIASDDPDENPFNFVVSGTGTGGAPEIAISSSESGAVNDGATDTFVSTPAAGSASTVTYTITNSGTDTLTLTTPTVGTNISGASNVTVNSLVLGSTSVAPGGETTTLVVNYTPTVAGSFGFALSLANDDADENPYDITVSGSSTGQPDIAISASEGGAQTDGVAHVLGNKAVATQASVTYTITNTGLANLTGLALTVNNASNVSIDNTPALTGGTSITPGGTAVTFDVQYTPTNNGAFSFDVSIASNDPDENPFNFAVSGTGTGGAPEIAVSSSQGGALTDGSPNALGNKAVTTQDTLTYTITNVGTADLTGLALTVDNASNVTLGTVTALTGTSITPGGTAVTFQVPYTPTNNGAFSFDVSIANNDPDENPFNFAVTGTGTGGAPEIAISSSESGAVNDGATDTFVSTPAAGSASTVTYTITNSGTDTLTLTTPTVGTNISGASNVTVNSLVLGSTSVAPGGGTTTLVVNYTPTLGGSFGFALSLANDDADENPYDITVSGSSTGQPDIAISASEGGAQTDGVAHVLGNKAVATQDSVTYTLTNEGLADLTGLALTVNNASNVTINNTPALTGTSITPSGTAVTFTVDYTPVINGGFGFDVIVASNDPDEAPFNFTVSGTGTGGAPEIEVSSSQGGALSDGVDQALGDKSVTTSDTLTYTLTNTGLADLTGLALTVNNANNVTIANTPTLTGTSITPGGTAVTFQVEYQPTINGAFSFDVSIANNDADETPFNFAVTGTGTGGAPEIDITGTGGGAVNDGSTDEIPEPAPAGQGSMLSYTITNSGTETLMVNMPSVSGNVSNLTNVTINSISFQVTASASTSARRLSPQAVGDRISLVPGATARLDVNYTPVTSGPFSFTVSLASNDSNEALYQIGVAGTASGAPEIEVSSSESGDLSDGGTDSVASEVIADERSQIVYTLTNSGNAPLTLTAPNLQSALSGQTNVTVNDLSLASTSVAGGASTTLTVGYTPTAGGAFAFTLSLANDDADENPFDITVDGNAEGIPALVAIVAGDDQAAVINTAFASPLSVRVSDANGYPVPGATVVFSAPGAGASLIFAETGSASQSVVTNDEGLAVSSSMTANDTASRYLGGRSFEPYAVTARVEGVEAVRFSLTNSRDSAADIARTQEVIASFVTHRADRIVSVQPDLVVRLKSVLDGSQHRNGFAFDATPMGQTGQFEFSLRAFAQRWGAHRQRNDAVSRLFAEADDQAAPASWRETPELDTGSLAFAGPGYSQEAPRDRAQPRRSASSNSSRAVQAGVGGSDGELQNVDVWVQGSFSNAETGGNKSQNAFFFGGIDYRYRENALIGVMAQLDISDEDNAGENTAADGLGWMVGPYTVVRLHQNLYFDGRATYGWSDNRVNALGLFYDDFSTERMLFQGGLTGDFTVGRYTFNPFARLTYYWEEQKSYEDTLGNAIPKQSFDLGRFEFGPKVSIHLPAENRYDLTLNFGVSGLYDFDQLLDDVRMTTGILSAQDKFRARVESGAVLFIPGPNVFVRGEGFYDGIGVGDFDAYGGTISVLVPF